jgi:hypothetical protein
VGTADNLVTTVVEFLQTIGIPCEYGEVHAGSVVPGVAIVAGALVVDVARLEYPGDLLHEAAHIAVLAPERRPGVEQADLDANQGDEIAAELWSFLAATELGVSPEVVFHRDGYQGSGQWLVETYRAGTLVGQPLLEWMGILDAQGEVVSWLRTRSGTE